MRLRQKDLERGGLDFKYSKFVDSNLCKEIVFPPNPDERYYVNSSWFIAPSYPVVMTITANTTNLDNNLLQSL